MRGWGWMRFPLHCLPRCGLAAAWRCCARLLPRRWPWWIFVFVFLFSLRKNVYLCRTQTGTRRCDGGIAWRPVCNIFKVTIYDNTLNFATANLPASEVITWRSLGMLRSFRGCSGKDNGGAWHYNSSGLPKCNKVKNSDVEVWQSICSMPLLLWLNGHNTVLCHLLGLYQ